MTTRQPRSLSRLALFAVLGSAFTLILALRVWGVSSRFWLLGDQIRDWRIALRPFSELPLVGPATHVNGYTIGPAFYWILWAIRVVFGPWFDYLPHAGGIGQAVLQSMADVLLVVAVWRRTGSMWLALTTCVLLVTASYDLALSALVWNPVLGSTLAKFVTAIVLLEWHRGSMLRKALTAALAWCAVHAYTGAVFVAVSTFLLLLVDPFIPARSDSSPSTSTTSTTSSTLSTSSTLTWRALLNNLLLLALVVALLQVPYVLHQLMNRFGDSAMGAVTHSVSRVLSGQDRPEFSKSVRGYAFAVYFIQIRPWEVPWLAWLLVPTGLTVLFAYRRDPIVLCMTLVPQLMAMAGYAFFLAALDSYYYLSLMPAAVLTLLLGIDAWTPRGAKRMVGAVLFVATLAMVPTRYHFAAGIHVMPEYRALVDGSRTIVRRGQPMRAIETDFELPKTADPEFIYGILGGVVDRQAAWVAVISRSGQVVYRPAASP
jgi:hypothetical protein